MSEITFYCVFCGREIKAPLSDVARRISCPACSRHIAVPSGIDDDASAALGPATLPMAQSRILHLEGRVAELRSELARAREEARRAVDDLASLRAQIGALQRSMQSTETARSLTDRKLADARSRSERLETQLLDARARARETDLDLRRARTEIHRLRYSYRGGSAPQEWEENRG